MTAPLTASQDALARIDDGIVLPDDPELAELLERHCRWEARPCLICGGEGGPECVRCVIAEDVLAKRREDV